VAISAPGPGQHLGDFRHLEKGRFNLVRVLDRTVERHARRIEYVDQNRAFVETRNELGAQVGRPRQANDQQRERGTQSNSRSRDNPCCRSLMQSIEHARDIGLAVRDLA
jgi:hypothetical protein